MRKQIRQWRVVRAEPSGLLVWFDPDVEVVRLYSLDPGQRSGVDAVSERDDQEGSSPVDGESSNGFRQEVLEMGD